MKRFKPTLVRGDCIKVLKTLKAESVDLSIHDPAYESLEKHRHGGPNNIRKMSTAEGWFKTFPNRRYKKWLAQLARIHKNNTHIYIVCDEETMDVIKSLGERDKNNDLWFHTKYGKLRYWKALVWNKSLMGMGYHYRAQKEFVLWLEKGTRMPNHPDFGWAVDRFCKDVARKLEDQSSQRRFILFLEKGKRRLADLGTPDVLTVTAIRRKDKYPTEKPVELMRILIRQSSNPGDVVLDSFLGSGSTILSAYEEGRRSIGIDVAKKSIRLAKKRLHDLREGIAKAEDEKKRLHERYVLPENRAEFNRRNKVVKKSAKGKKVTPRKTA